MSSKISLHRSRGFALALTLALATGPGFAAPADPLGGVGGEPLSGSVTVRVVEAGSTLPVPGAFVMVGPAEGDPFAGNVGTTNASGEIVFGDPSLVGTLTVTAGAAGRGYGTVFGLGVDEVVLPLADLAVAPTARLGDQFESIEVNNGFLCAGDGNLDIGIVFPAVPLSGVLGDSGLLDLFLSSTTEPGSTPLGPVDIPSNMYLPLQCELFGNYSKTVYHTRLPLGTQTLFGLTARGSLGTFLDLTSGFDNSALVGLISDLTFRELDILRDVVVTGDTDDADLVADLPLTQNLTLNVSNALLGTSVFAAAGGRVTADDGGELLFLTGLDAFDPDTAGASATLGLTTHPASGELAEMIHGALVILLGDEGVIDGSSIAVMRSGFTPPTTLTFDSFYDIVELSLPQSSTLAWTDVTSLTSPPLVDLHTTSLNYEKEVPNPDAPAEVITQTQTYWQFYSTGSGASLTLPTLPAAAPTALPDPGATPDVDGMAFSHQAIYLGDTTFDYDGFAFSDVASFASHVSTAGTGLNCPTTTAIGGLELARGASPGEVVLGWAQSTDACHDIFAARAYEVYAGTGAAPATPPGTWPIDPVFTQVTADDLDGDLRDTSFRHVPAPGLVLYLVTDRGLAGNEGPVGHYGS